MHKINFEFKRGSVPPTIPTRYVGCLGGCDEMLSEVLNVHDFSRSNNTTQQQARPTAANNNNRNRPGNNEARKQQPRPNNKNRNATATTTNNSRSDGATNFFGGSGFQTNPTRNTSTFHANQHGGEGGGGEENEIVCNCNVKAIQLTVRKEGPNQGRLFYKCSNQASQCDFFLWHDEPSGSGGGGGSCNRQGHGDNQGEIKCQCNQSAPLRSVQKDGPNKGRQFYVCGKPRGQQCQFFQWADETPNEQQFRGRGRGRGGRGGSGGSSNARRGGGRGDGGNGGGSGRKRKCGSCGQEGHTKKTCPFQR